MTVLNADRFESYSLNQMAVLCY